MKIEDVVVGMSVRVHDKTEVNGCESWKSFSDYTGIQKGGIGKVSKIDKYGIVVDFKMKDGRTTQEIGYTYHFTPENIEPVDPNEAFFLKWKEAP
jgi:hypothetical protein